MSEARPFIFWALLFFGLGAGGPSTTGSRPFRCIIFFHSFVSLPTTHFLQKTIMLFPPLPPHVHRLFCGVCDSLEASRAWWIRRRSKSRSSTDEADAASTCADQDGDIAEETIVYYDNPTLNLTAHSCNPQSASSRRGPQQVTFNPFIMVNDGRNLSHVLRASDIEDELLQLTGNPQAPFDDDESLSSLESI